MLLPCNVVVRQDAGDKTVVDAMDPDAALGLVGLPEIRRVSNDVSERIHRVMARIEA